MKIIFSNYDDISNPYYGGGGAIAVHQVAKRLAQKHHVEVITGKYPGSKENIIDNVWYKRVGIGFMGPFIGMLSFSLCLPLLSLNKSYNVWLESFTPPFSTGFIPLFTKKPVIALVHMLGAQDMKRKYKMPFDWVESFGLKFYSHFIVTSRLAKEKIKKINKQANFTLIPNGVDIPDYAPITGRHILYIGRVEMNQKGIDLLIDAQKEIYRKTRTKLLIAGTGNSAEVKKLKILINKQNIKNCVSYVGKINGKKWEAAYKNSKLVVLPSRFDTYPLVILEAAAHSKPLVIFDIDNLNWVPKEIALRAKPFDPYSLAKQVIRLLTNNKLRLSMCSKALSFAKKRSWESTSESYLKAINQAVANNYPDMAQKSAVNFKIR
jgi:phosphatidylinositol alpha-mannosyltransferase